MVRDDPFVIARHGPKLHFITLEEVALLNRLGSATGLRRNEIRLSRAVFDRQRAAIRAQGGRFRDVPCLIVSDWIVVVGGRL